MKLPNVGEVEGLLLIAAIAGGFLLLSRLGVFRTGAFNPSSDQNVAYGAANSIFSEVSGNNVDTLGTWFYGITHPNEGVATPPYVYNPAFDKGSDYLWGSP